MMGIKIGSVIIIIAMVSMKQPMMRTTMFIPTKNHQRRNFQSLHCGYQTRGGPGVGKEAAESVRCRNDHENHYRDFQGPDERVNHHLSCQLAIASRDCQSHQRAGSGRFGRGGEPQESSGPRR